MAVDPDGSVDSQMVELVKIILHALTFAGYGEATGTVGQALIGALGVERAARVWDAATCWLDQDTEWNLVKGETDGN